MIGIHIKLTNLKHDIRRLENMIHNTWSMQPIIFKTFTLVHYYCRDLIYSTQKPCEIQYDPAVSPTEKGYPTFKGKDREHLA